MLSQQSQAEAASCNFGFTSSIQLHFPTICRCSLAQAALPGSGLLTPCHHARDRVQQRRAQAGTERVRSRPRGQPGLSAWPLRKLGRQKAANGVGLVQLAMLLNVILDHCPYAEMHISFVKDLLLWLQSEFTTISGSMSPSLWASWMTERLLTILSHLRRVHGSAIRLAECSSRLSPDQTVILTGLLSRIQRQGSADAPAKCSTPSPSKRLLQKQPSEVTVDSQGVKASLCSFRSMLAKLMPRSLPPSALRSPPRP